MKTNKFISRKQNLKTEDIENKSVKLIHFTIFLGGLDYFQLFWSTVNFEECKVVLGFEVEFKTHICLKRDASAAQLMQRLVGYAN